MARYRRRGFRFSFRRVRRNDITAAVGQIASGLITLWVANSILDLVVPTVNGNTNKWMGDITTTVKGTMPILALLVLVLPILNVVRKGLY